MIHVVLRALLALSLASLAAPALAGPSWTGTWDTRWQDGGARLELTQDGSEVQGRYPSYEGRIEGRVDGLALRGRWHMGARSGPLEFVLAPDGKTFVGRYDDGQWWTGGRVEAEHSRAQPIDQTSPRETLRSFLDAGNAARRDAPDLYARAAAALAFDGEADIPLAQKIERARALFLLVDQTTFRLSALPDMAWTEDGYAITLPQAGTEAALRLSFVRRDAKWFIVEPDDAALDAARKALLARSNGRPPLADDYRQRRTARDALLALERAFFAWDKGGAGQAREALDLSRLPEAVREYSGDLTAQYLNGILNRVGMAEPQEIPDDPGSSASYVVFSHPVGNVVIAPVVAGRATTWKFTAETVASARELFIVVEDMPPMAGRKLPAPASAYFELRHRIRGLAPALLTQVGTLELWQILGWAGVMLAALGLGFLLGRAVFAAFRVLLPGADRDRLGRDLRWPLRIGLACAFYKLMIPALGLPDYAKEISIGVTGTALALAVMWLAWGLLDALTIEYFGRKDGKLITIDNILVSLAFGFLKLLVLAVGFTFIAVELSLPYEGIVASLSIGGLAVAFASRETLSNVFGAAVLAIDRPFRCGDVIEAGDVKGTVEHVGIRSTRVRGEDDSLIIMPNGKLADALVNNRDSRRHHLYEMTLPLPYGTSARQVEELMAALRTLVASIPQAAPERTSITITGLSESGIGLRLKYGLDARGGGDGTTIANAVALDVLRLCERSGIDAAAAPRPVAARPIGGGAAEAKEADAA